MSKKWSKFVSAAVIVMSSAIMFTVTSDAEARRMGGGKSFGRQSTQINRTPATQAPTAPAARSSAAPAAGAAAGTAAAATQRSGMSRFLGPIAGIAAGLGIAALLSSLGLGGALLEFISSAVLIGLVIFAIMFIVRRLRGGSARPAYQGAEQASSQARYSDNLQPPGNQPMQRNDLGAQQATPAFNPVTPAAAKTEVAQPVDTSWYIPADFNSVAFLQEAKKQFAHVQAIWDKGDVEQLRAYLTDDLVKELTPQITENAGRTKTDIVLLNAELLGMEQVADGHLASVRFSGMLREEANQAAFRFEEVWNLYKTENSGWLLAGIQQIPVEN